MRKQNKTTMSEVKSRKTNNESFKKTLVDLYNAGKGVTELSREYDIPQTNIHKWIRRYSPIRTSTGEITSNDEIIMLRKQMN